MAIHDLTNKRILNMVQRDSVNRVISTFGTGGHDALCMLAGAPPLMLKIKERAELYEQLHKSIRRTGLVTRAADT